MRMQQYFWIIPFISFLGGYLLLGSLFQPKEFETPAIVGKQLLNAVSVLSDHKLNIRFLAQKEESDLPQGTILSQKPLSGRKIKANQSVYVVISKKPPKIPCPALLGKPLNTLLKELEQKNIRNKSYFLPSNHPKNNCIAQYPCPLTPLKGKNVITYVSDGNKKPVILPDFKHKKIVQVVEFLKKYAPYIKVEMIHSPRCELHHMCDQNCIVSDQRPLAGSIVKLDGKNPIKVHLKIVKK